jgi:hypothetical protein
MFPPNCVRIGTVKHFYEQPQVISIDIDPSVTVRLGDTLLIRLQNRYHLQPIESIQVKKVSVTEAHGGERVGIKTSLHQGDIPFEATVFTCTLQTMSVADSK